MSPTTDRAPVGRLSTIVLDCPDPRALAGFYGALLGWAVDDSATEEDWVELDTGGAIGLAFQQVSAYRPPQWPGQDHPQQAHLDIRVGDLDEGERQVVALGATRHQTQPGRTFRVFLDPAGHPFCLVR